MKKYIIKNCPKYDNFFNPNETCKSHFSQYCENASSYYCPLKRIAEMCRDEMRFSRKSDLALATDIMSFLDIEEVEG